MTCISLSSMAEIDPSKEFIVAIMLIYYSQIRTVRFSFRQLEKNCSRGHLTVGFAFC